MEHSTGYVLFMYDAKFTNSGPYTCEVIVDTTFDTLMFTKKLLVIGKNSEFRDICSVTFKLFFEALNFQYKMSKNSKILPMTNNFLVNMSLSKVVSTMTSQV